MRSVQTRKRDVTSPTIPLRAPPCKCAKHQDPCFHHQSRCTSSLSPDICCLDAIEARKKPSDDLEKPCTTVAAQSRTPGSLEPAEPLPITANLRCCQKPKSHTPPTPLAPPHLYHSYLHHGTHRPCPRRYRSAALPHAHCHLRTQRRRQVDHPQAAV